jgi:glycogen synthase
MVLGTDIVRILHLSSLYPPTVVGGAEKVAAMLAEAQAEAGHEVFATSLTREPQPPGSLNGVATHPLKSRNPLWIQESSRYPTPVRLANKAATVFNIVTARQFGALLDEIRPDVLHSHSMVELPPAVWREAAARKVAIVHTLHDYDLLCIRGALFKDGVKCEPRHLACRLLSAPKRAAHDRIDVAVAVSQTVMDRHLEHGLFAHLPTERRHVLWNPVALDPVTPSPASARSGPFRFGFLGRLVSEKGLGVLIEACRRLHGDWTLTVAGVGPEAERFKAEAAGLPISFAGFVDPPAFFAEIDALVAVPIWDEPFGLTVLEAYGAGKRVIGSSSGAIGEFINRVDPGWTVPPGDPDALMRAMAAAMTASTDVAPQQVFDLMSELQPSRVAARYLELYDQARSVHR